MYEEVMVIIFPNLVKKKTSKTKYSSTYNNKMATNRNILKGEEKRKKKC